MPTQMMSPSFFACPFWNCILWILQSYRYPDMNAFPFSILHLCMQWNAFLEDTWHKHRNEFFSGCSKCIIMTGWQWPGHCNVKKYLWNAHVWWAASEIYGFSMKWLLRKKEILLNFISLSLEAMRMIRGFNEQTQTEILYLTRTQNQIKCILNIEVKSWPNDMTFSQYKWKRKSITFIYVFVARCRHPIEIHIAKLVNAICV